MWIRPPRPKTLAYGTVKGTVDSLGDIGDFVFPTPDEVKQENNYTQEQLERIGVEVQEKNREVVTITPWMGPMRRSRITVRRYHSQS